MSVHDTYGSLLSFDHKPSISQSKLKTLLPDFKTRYGMFHYRGPRVYADKQYMRLTDILSVSYKTLYVSLYHRYINWDLLDELPRVPRVAEPSTPHSFVPTESGGEIIMIPIIRDVILRCLDRFSTILFRPVDPSVLSPFHLGEDVSSSCLHLCCTMHLVDGMNGEAEILLWPLASAWCQDVTSHGLGPHCR
ncbi:hypothetical protein VTK56DRAFT_6839 [Thermocarpiscus australiensis]